MMRVTKRTARKRHRCPCCGYAIYPGQSYFEHVASPWHGDLGNDQWWRLQECLQCAIRYGRELAA